MCLLGLVPWRLDLWPLPKITGFPPPPAVPQITPEMFQRICSALVGQIFAEFEARQSARVAQIVRDVMSQVGVSKEEYKRERAFNEEALEYLRLDLGIVRGELQKSERHMEEIADLFIGMHGHEDQSASQNQPESLPAKPCHAEGPYLATPRGDG